MIVASLKLPVAVRHLRRTVNALEKLYGKGLTMQEDPEGWLCIIQPGRSAGESAKGGGDEK